MCSTIVVSLIHQLNETAMTTTINNKKFEVKETNGKFFYWSMLAARWIPVAKERVQK